jgi:cathepsin L
LCGSAFSSQWEKELDIVDFANMDLAETFKDWKSNFGREYMHAEEEFAKFKVFVNNLRRIAKYNSEDHSAKLRANQFADMTDDEFRHAMFGESGSCIIPDDVIRIGGRRKERGMEDVVHMPKGTSVDWTVAGCVTPVKNQGQCGSCWAFSTTGSIECNWAIQNNQCGGSITSLSEQQLVDCSRLNAGCNGGNMATAMSYVTNEGGLCSESEYPYVGKDGTCQSSTCGTKYDAISSHNAVTTESESALMAAVDQGCVSVAVEADQFAFQYYSSGVLDGTCGTNLDHGVLVTGYGTYTNGEDYWKVKNSWGESWGMNGYILICRDCGKNGNDGECGILMDPIQPVV